MAAAQTELAALAARATQTEELPRISGVSADANWEFLKMKVGFPTAG